MALTLRSGEERGKERGALGHGLHEDVLANGMRAVADCAEAVERGNTKSGGEITVGTSARGGFAKGETQLSGEGFCAGEEGGAVFSLKRRAPKSASDFKFGAAVNWLKGVKAGFESAHVRRTPGAQVKSGHGAIGNDVGTRATLDDVGIDGDAAARAVPTFDAGNLRGEFVDGVDAFLRGEAGMGSAAVNDKLRFADALAGSFDQAAGTKRGFKHEDRVAAAGLVFNEEAGGLTSDFFVGRPKENKSFFGREFQLDESFKSKKRLDDAGFHVESARTIGLAAGNSIRHVNEGARGIHGVVMAKDQKLAAGSRGVWRPNNSKVVTTMLFFNDVNDPPAE